MGLKVIMLNPKAVKLFAAGRWESAGRPTPLVAVAGRGDEVTLTDAITGRSIGHGHLEGTREDGDGNTFYDANTSHGVRPQGKGYGLALYCGLAMQARSYYRVAGVSSPDGGGAVDLWNTMVESGLASGDTATDTDEKEESTDLDIEVSLPAAGYGRRSGTISYDDMIAAVRSSLDIPDEVDDSDIEVELDDSSVRVPVTVRWKEPVAGSYFLTAGAVDASGLVVGGFDGPTALHLDDGKQVPADLLAAIPIVDSRSLRNVVSLLQQLGQDTSIEKMLQREDLQHLFQSEGRQMMVPGVPAHYPRPAAWKAEQRAFPGMSGLAGGRRRGLGDLPRGLALSARAQGILHRCGDID